MQIKITFTPLVLILVMVSSPMLAHHAAAQYDRSKLTVLKATITNFVWANPHCQVSFDTTDEKGEVRHWNIEAPSPWNVAERGWTSKSLKSGDVVTMHFYAAKNGASAGWMVKAVFPNGKELWARPPQEEIDRVTTAPKDSQ